MTRLVIGRYPTPVERLEGSLFVKRDDRTNATYGGNKVRKLEYLLAEARARGARRLLTLGAVGSNQVVALGHFGRAMGFEVEAVLVPQPWSEKAERNARTALALGVRAIAAPSWSAAPAYVAWRLAFRRGIYFVPLGGSSALGSLGFVDAAEELVQQVREGRLPVPRVVVVPVGSGGTAAGLAVGFERAGLPTRVIGAATSPPSMALDLSARRLALLVGRRVGLSRRASLRAAGRITIESRWIGEGYGVATPEGERAIAEAERLSSALASPLVLDPVYTAKGLACALAWSRRRPGDVVLYWHTLSAVSLPAGDPEAPLPVPIARLLRRT